jgi:hypothetical protein
MAERKNEKRNRKKIEKRGKKTDRMINGKWKI